METCRRRSEEMQITVENSDRALLKDVVSKNQFGLVHEGCLNGSLKKACILFGQSNTGYCGSCHSEKCQLFPCLACSDIKQRVSPEMLLCHGTLWQEDLCSGVYKNHIRYILPPRSQGTAEKPSEVLPKSLPLLKKKKKSMIPYILSR